MNDERSLDFYVGTYERKLDEKNRFIIPSKIMKVLQKRCEFYNKEIHLLPNESNNALYALDKAYLINYNEFSVDKPEECSIDSQRRCVIPEKFMKLFTTKDIIIRADPDQRDRLILENRLSR